MRNHVRNACGRSARRAAVGRPSVAACWSTEAAEVLTHLLARMAAAGDGRASGTSCIPHARNIASFFWLPLGGRPTSLTCAFESPADRRYSLTLVMDHRQEAQDRLGFSKKVVVLATVGRCMAEEQSQGCCRQVDAAEPPAWRLFASVVIVLNHNQGKPRLIACKLPECLVLPSL